MHNLEKECDRLAADTSNISISTDINRSRLKNKGKASENVLIQPKSTFSTFLQFCKIEGILFGETADNIKIYQEVRCNL